MAVFLGLFVQLVCSMQEPFNIAPMTVFARKIKLNQLLLPCRVCPSFTPTWNLRHDSKSGDQWHGKSPDRIQGEGEEQRPLLEPVNEKKDRSGFVYASTRNSQDVYNLFKSASAYRK
jgi:hypothetical protein